MRKMFVLVFVCSVITVGNMSSCKEATKETANSIAEESAETVIEGNLIRGWHGYNRGPIGKAWSFDDGVISFDKSRGEGGDIVTDEEYENFELTLDWKISDCGNSGIFWNIVESKQYKYPWMTGPEMQILDNKCHPDAKIDTHRAGDLYDMIETSEMTVKPAGEWNNIKVRSASGTMTFWQNDVQVVQFTMHDESWDKMVSESKFKDIESFGKAKKGRIGLQDHGDKVWFRNIKITHL